MLKSAHRLRHWKDFQAVYKLGTRFQGSTLTLRGLPRQTQTKGEIDRKSPTRFGISISRKVTKKATGRNRIKRQIRAALHQLYPYIEPGWDFILSVKPSAVQCNYSQFLQELNQLLAKAEVLHGHSRGNLL
ncbi:ribonuclease P protein component [Oscillatoriales cyanobacterium LEGE 11467]|uniref:Ribonuclease P protein component n=1 Tax=Zarconia navalis LEGE 11467 TaxID=1828826 RepID=A0A928W2P8_9CYAN|nr:ribonuclease P protein component [Zarconia navalis]MBE9042155.1 ribonuclease P protein component [Zarconia navalis LEGE 11467]